MQNALVCIIWIGISGGLGERDWGADGEKLGCERELGRGEHGLLGIGPLGILMLGSGTGAETPPGVRAYGEDWAVDGGGGGDWGRHSPDGVDV